MVRHNWLRCFLWSAGIVVLLVCVYWSWQHFTARPDRSLLAGTPFATPGWQGIVPGKSTRGEAWQILKRSPYIRRASIWTTEAPDHSGAIRELVYWDNKSLGLLPVTGVLRNQMVIANNKVLLIEIFLKHEVRVSQVIEHFGNPLQIIRCHQEDGLGTPYTAIYLWYGTEGLALQSRGAYSVYEGLLVPESYVTNVYYFEPMEPDEFVSQLGRPIYLCLVGPPQIQEWSGYDTRPTP